VSDIVSSFLVQFFAHLSVLTPFKPTHVAKNAPGSWAELGRCGARTAALPCGEVALRSV
jgi:hypothetical protein